MTDTRTIAVYDAKAHDYAEFIKQDQPDRQLSAFIEEMAEGGTVLDVGCGPAAASNFMRSAGLKPDPVDASQGMVNLANETFDIGARVATFDDIKAVNRYDGIWANFSLLHAAPEDLPRYLLSLSTALKQGGLFHIGMKTGVGTTRDRLDRRYTFVKPAELETMLTNAGLRVHARAEGEEAGLEGTIAPWIVLRARKHG